MIPRRTDTEQARSFWARVDAAADMVARIARRVGLSSCQDALFPRDDERPCFRCGGTGRITVDKGDREDCPECDPRFKGLDAFGRTSVACDGTGSCEKKQATCEHKFWKPGGACSDCGKPGVDRPLPPEPDPALRRKADRESCLRRQAEILIGHAGNLVRDHADEASLRAADDMLARAREHLSSLLMGEAMSRG